MSFNPAIITDNLPQILAGLRLTILLWLAGTVAGMALGFVLAVFQTSRLWPVRLLVAVYQSIFRGTPFLVQIFLLYYGGPLVGLMLSAETAGVLGLTLYSAAYFTEIFRAGFGAVNVGQAEAGQICGLSKFQILRHIQLPQMMVTITPALVGMFIVMSKETAILSVMTVPEITAVLSGIGSATFTYVETLLVLVLCYWVLVGVTTWIGGRVERRMQRHLLTANGKTA
ncbi:amino acid ABC transporter permease [Aquamicrobium ahrensii]|uniref:Polar amino acid transport system permease protein n=1 Tax=Aquamicrobium ahrensii TaxID=469551 RepID=A0ABV2KRC4_9HYPH